MPGRPGTSNLKADPRTERASSSVGLLGTEKFRFTQQNERMLLHGASLEWRGQIQGHSGSTFWTPRRWVYLDFIKASEKVLYGQSVDKIQLSMISSWEKDLD